MANPRKCPHCQIFIGKSYTFDEDLNLICDKCGKVAFPTTEEAEKIFNPRPLYPVPLERTNVNPVPNYRPNKNNLKMD